MSNEEIVTLERLLKAMREVEVFRTDDIGGNSPYMEALGRKLVRDFTTKWPWQEMVYEQPLQVSFHEPMLNDSRTIVIQYGTYHPTVQEFVDWLEADLYWKDRGCPGGREQFFTHLGWVQVIEDDEPWEDEVEEGPKPIHAKLEVTYVRNPGDVHEERESMAGAEIAFVTAGGMNTENGRHNVVRWIPGTEWTELIVEVTDPLPFYQNVCIAAMRNLILWGGGSAFRVRNVSFPVEP